MAGSQQATNRVSVPGFEPVSSVLKISTQIYYPLSYPKIYKTQLYNSTERACALQIFIHLSTYI